jgi:hypothetical protein
MPQAMLRSGASISLPLNGAEMGAPAFCYRKTPVICSSLDPLAFMSVLRRRTLTQFCTRLRSSSHLVKSAKVSDAQKASIPKRAADGMPVSVFAGRQRCARRPTSTGSTSIKHDGLLPTEMMRCGSSYFAQRRTFCPRGTASMKSNARIAIIGAGLGGTRPPIPASAGRNRSRLTGPWTGSMRAWRPSRSVVIVRSDSIQSAANSAMPSEKSTSGYQPSSARNRAESAVM